MNAILLLVGFLSVMICFFEGTPLLKEKRQKEMIVMGFLIGIALIISLIDALGLATPLILLARWLRPIGEMVFKHY